MRVDIYKISHNYYYLENQYCTQNSCCFCAILCILEHTVLSDFDQIMEYVKRLYIKLYFQNYTNCNVHEKMFKVHTYVKIQFII